MEKLGRYQIREIIGEGAMARVYKGYDPEIDREIAIKLLKSQLAEDDQYRMRFLREAKGAGTLSHADIVGPYREMILGKIRLARPLRVAVDGGSGSCSSTARSSSAAVEADAPQGRTPVSNS